VSVTGTVASVSKDIMGDTSVALATDNQFLPVRCSFFDSAKPQIAKLQKGDQVTVSGTCAGKPAMDVVIKDCTAAVKAPQ